MSDLDVSLRELRAAYLRNEDLWTIHYACESFAEANDHPPQVSCICMCRVTDHGMQVFSPIAYSPDLQRPDREKALLENFYQYLRKNSDMRLIHWNMNASRYGFAALASRYEYLFGKRPAYVPPAHRLHDLDALIGDKFGEEYAGHPKLRSLASLNGYSMRFFLSGAEEAELLTNSEFGRIESSTSEKARIIAQLFAALCRGALKTLNSVGTLQFAGEHLDAVAVVLRLGERFRNVERALRRRHSDRPTLNITDEYDAQDLLRSLLNVFFEDIRAEDVVPEYAGGTSRIDFILPEFSLAVELKYTRKTLRAKELGEQLIVDRDRYRSHSGARHLVCLVFDYEGYIDNPRGIERDLTRQSSSEGIAVTVRIYDR